MIHHLNSLESLNAVVEDYKAGVYGSECFLYHTSDWDSSHDRRMNEIISNFSDSEINFFIINWFDDPSMWKVFRPSMSPALVILTESGPKIQVIPQMINITLDALAKKFVAV